MNWKSTGKKIWKRTWQLTIVLFLMLCILEIAYRYQWIDFFKTEFKALNKNIDSKKSNVLVFGDSFTAHNGGYVDQLRKAHPKYNFVNCAMPGSGAYEMELIASGRIEDYPPKCVIYQMYVGNDLTDIAPPTNWSELSISRNCYWTAKQYFSIFGLFSRRLSGLQVDFNDAAIKQDTLAFSIKNYSPRTRMMIKAEHDYVQNCVKLSKEYKDAFEECKESIEYLREQVPKNIPIYIVMIPHFSQVTKEYNSRYKTLSGSKTSMKENYPFFKRISEFKGVQVLNPMPYFRRKELEGVQLYFNNDPHLTDEGQKVLFEFLDAQLKKEWK